MRFGLITALSATLALVGCGDKDDDGSDGTDDGDDTTPVDADGDGFDASDDCDDTNADINPSAAEDCDGLDNNCDGEVDEGVTSAFYGDLDGDGYAGDTLVVEACEAPDGFYAEATDCDDLDATVSPDASEVCDGADNDCDGLVDDDDDSLDTSTQVMVYTDADSDGYGDDGTGVMACAAGSGQSELGGDCDDDDIDVNPDTVWYIDFDGDGYGYASVTTQACEQPEGYVADNTDCDESSALVNPGMAEVCDDDNVDEDCSGDADDADAGVDTSTYGTFYADTDADGYGDEGSVVSQRDMPSGYAADWSDCDDGDSAVNPGEVEVCNDGLDNDCSGDAPECGMSGDYLDTDYDYLITGTETYEYEGHINAVVDIDGDGYDDLFAGSPYYDDTVDNEGRIGVFRGPITADADIDGGSAEWIGGEYLAYVGLDLAEAGDLNGDGHDDLLVGGLGSSDYYGSAYVVYGGTSVASDWGSAYAAELSPTTTYDYAYAVAGVGDVNGDGYDDFVQGAYGSDYSDSNSGMIYLFWGGATAMSGSLSSADEAGVIFYGQDYYEYFGARGGGGTMAGSDMDGDGYSDMVYGGHYYDADYVGGAFLYYGSTSLSSTYTSDDADLILNGSGTYGDFGYLVKGGDFDNDGYGDVLITEPDTDYGHVYLLYGSTTRYSGSSTITDVAGTTIVGEVQYDDLGWYGNVGDMNADGTADIVLTARYYDGTAGQSTGAAYAFYGPVSAGGSWSADDAGMMIEGTTSYDYFGEGQVSLGDHNGDGADDMFFGQEDYGSGEGAIYVFNQSGI